jgi:hypothetical protein
MRIAQIAFLQVSSTSTSPGTTGQFHMSFEPTIGRIAAGDERFIAEDEGPT